MLAELREKVCRANCALAEYNLVALTWGNVSAIDREKNLVVIKPSGVAYSDLTPESMVVLDLAGNVVEGDLRPSSDTPTHLHLYKIFPAISAITHTHSRYATIFAQARIPIPCFGTTHADTFCGEVPLTRPLASAEVQTDYELNTGKVIEERFLKLDPAAVPGVLVAGHAPFTWGKTPKAAVENSVILEEIAFMAFGTVMLKKEAETLEQYVLDKHYSRKHGPAAYYGQKTKIAG